MVLNDGVILPVIDTQYETGSRRALATSFLTTIVEEELRYVTAWSG
jgi:hypothetical protein